MKKITILCLAFFICQTITAQMRMGVTGYYNSVKVNPHIRELASRDGSHAYNFGLTSHQNHYSIGAGLFNNYGNLFLLGEALYRVSISTYAVQNHMQGERIASEISEKRQACQIPVAAGVDFGMIRLGVGPTFEIILDETNHIGAMSDIVRKERKVNCGFQFLAGLDLHKHIIINLKYEQDFNKTGDMYYYNNLNTRIQSRVNRLSVGIGFYL